MEIYAITIEREPPTRSGYIICTAGRVVWREFSLRGVMMCFFFLSSRFFFVGIFSLANNIQTPTARANFFYIVLLVSVLVDILQSIYKIFCCCYLRPARRAIARS